MTNSQIVDNYINGNLTDFKDQLKKTSKKNLLFVVIGIAEHLSVKNDYANANYSDNGYFKAIEVVDKYL